MLGEAKVKAIVLISALLMSGSALAAEIDVTTPLTDLDGKTITVDGKPDGAPMILRIVAVNALLATYPEERDLGGDKKAERFVLASQIHTASKIDLTAENTALLKQLIGNAYGPLVVGRAFEIIDPASIKK
jgi:hypothetical protein